MKKRGSQAVRLAVAWLACGAAIVFAQPGEEGVGEVSAYTGFAMGALGSHPVVGGTTGLVAFKYAIGLVDTSFMPLGSRTLVHYPAATRNSQFFDINFTVDIQVPVNHRVLPYGLFGPALLFNRYQIQTIQPLGSVSFVGQDDVKFGFQTGGGLRYFVRDNWGVRAEYRYTISSQNFGTIGTGVFYQFSTPWLSSPFLHRGHRKRGAGPAL
jgi:opacity protein-like surface antigen